MIRRKKVGTEREREREREKMTAETNWEIIRYGLKDDWNERGMKGEIGRERYLPMR